MPLSKPVKKQQLLLPSPKDFHLLATEKKEYILKRLSTDNLIVYLEYIVASYHNPSKAECFTLEQIVEDDVRLSNYSDDDTFIADWITKNSSMSSRWQTSGFNSGKENNVSQFKVAIERPASGIDLRFANDSPASYFPKSNNTLKQSASKSTLAASFNHDAFMSSANHGPFGMEEKTRSYSQYTSKSAFGGNAFPIPYDGPSAFSFKHGGGGQGVMDSASKYSPYEGLFTKTPVTQVNQQQSGGRNRVNPFAAKNLDAAFSNTMVEPPVTVPAISNNAGQPTLELKDLDILAAYNLPEPNVFNDMPAESRAKILSSLPRNVKNKYEYFCWSYKLNQLYSERPICDDLFN